MKKVLLALFFLCLALSVYAWWDSNYAYRMKLDLDVNDSAGGALTNFVALVSLNSTTHANFFSHTCADKNTGIDFVDADDATDLNWHAEDTNSTNAYYWVSVPSVAYTSADYIYVYYDSDVCTDNQNMAGTYDVNFIRVFHMNSDVNGIDATGKKNAQKVGTPDIIADGIIGKGVNLDGSSELYDALSEFFAGKTQYTVLRWYSVDTNTALVHRFWGSYTGSSYAIMESIIDDPKGFSAPYIYSGGSGTNISLDEKNIPTNKWTFFATTFNAGTSVAYRRRNNDINSATKTGFPSTIPSGGVKYGIGARWYTITSAYGNFFDGKFDEFKFFDRALSMNEIQAYFKSDSGTFITDNAEETGTPANTAPDINIVSPNGDGNYLRGDANSGISFTVKDSENDELHLKIAYSSTAGLFTNSIIADLNLNNTGLTNLSCQDRNWLDTTQCTYSWVVPHLNANYFIDLNVWDTSKAQDISSSAKSFMIDSGIPNTTDNHPSGWQDTNVTVTFNTETCYDGSGCLLTQYRLNSGAWQTYTAPFVIATDGNNQLDYNSTDRAGNMETTKSVWVAIQYITFTDMNLFIVNDYTHNIDLNIRSDVNVVFDFNYSGSLVNPNSLVLYHTMNSEFNDANCTLVVRDVEYCGWNARHMVTDINWNVIDTYSDQNHMLSSSEDDHVFLRSSYNLDPDTVRGVAKTTISLNHSKAWVRTLLTNVGGLTYGGRDSNMLLNLSFSANYVGTDNRALTVYDCNTDLNTATPISNSNCNGYEFTNAIPLDSDGYYSVKTFSNDANQQVATNSVLLNKDGNHWIYFVCDKCNATKYWTLNVTNQTSNIDRTRNWSSTTGIADIAPLATTPIAHYHWQRGYAKTFNWIVQLSTITGLDFNSPVYSEVVDYQNLRPLFSDLWNPLQQTYSGLVDINASVSDPNKDTIVCDFYIFNNAGTLILATLNRAVVNNACGLTYNSALYADGNYTVGITLRETTTSELFSRDFNAGFTWAILNIYTYDFTVSLPASCTGGQGKSTAGNGACDRCWVQPSDSLPPIDSSDLNCEGQNVATNTAFVKVSFTGTATSYDLNFDLNATPATGLSVLTKCDSGDSTGATTLTSATQTICNNVSGDHNVFMWLKFTNYSVANGLFSTREIDINSGIA